MSSKDDSAPGPHPAARARLTPVAFEHLSGFRADAHMESWATFLRSARHIVAGQPELRLGTPPSAALLNICRDAVSQPVGLDGPAIAAAYARYFTPHFIEPGDSPSATRAEPAFLTAYYRPEVAASLTPTPDFSEPIRARPADLVTLTSQDTLSDQPHLTSARRRPDGTLAAFPTRAEIDRGALGDGTQVVAYVADAIEAFMIQVQGSARLRLSDGSALDLAYAGRNGHPYVSIGKILVESGEISTEDMSLDRLKSWVRDNGQELGQRGRALLHRNPSFVFFAASEADHAALGPIGAAGVPLTENRSIAVDRSLWSYGLPFWIEGRLPWSTPDATDFARLMIAQDTGSAILGPARADLYFGSGPKAGRLAGGLRHHARMFVFLPRGDAP